jgi:hypothetical protein
LGEVGLVNSDGSATIPTLISGAPAFRPMSGEAEGGGEKRLDWKDYLALFVAMLQTVALPMILLIVAILAALVIFRLVN